MLNASGQLILVPILLAFWGKQLYGEWLVLSAAVAYLSALDFGMQTYVVNRLNQCYALGNPDEYTRVLHSGLLFSIVVPGLALLLTIPLLIAAPLDAWLHVKAAPRSTVVWVLILLNIQVLFAIPLGFIGGIYRTINEYARGQMFSNARYLAWAVLTGIVVACGGGMSAVALTQLGLLVVLALSMYVDLRRRHPEVHIGLAGASFALAKSFLAPSSMFFGLQILSALMVQGSTILVTSMFGAGTVVVFVTLRTLANLIRQITVVVQNPAWPEFTALEARSEHTALQRLHFFTAKLVLFVAVCASIFLILNGDRLVDFWTHHRVPYDSALMVALLLFVCSQAHWSTSSILLSACNRQHAVLWCCGISTVMGFGAAYVLGTHMGVAGFGFGLAAADALFCAVTLPWIACSLSGESIVRFFTAVSGRSLLLFLALFPAAQLVVTALKSHAGPVVQLLVAGTAISVMGAAGAYLIFFNRQERSRVRLIVGSRISGFLARS